MCIEDNLIKEVKSIIFTVLGLWKVHTPRGGDLEDHLRIVPTTQSKGCIMQEWMSIVPFYTGWQVTFTHSCEISGGRVFFQDEGKASAKSLKQEHAEGTLETAGRPVWLEPSD